MMKVVSLSIWSNAAYMKGNDRERMEAFICEYPGECPMYAAGKCVCKNLFIGWIKCPHSRFVKDFGLTRRAKGFGAAAEKWRELYKTDITVESEQMCRCGDYIYLPYPHLDVFGTKFDESLVNDYFVPADSFTTQMISKIINYRPRAFMGGEITTFQEKEVPKFIKHLAQFSPELFEEYCNTNPEESERFLSVSRESVGRKAYLHTMKDGAYFFDCHHQKWIKDNGFIICDKYTMTLGLAAGKKPRKVMQGITDDMIVKVMDNDFVLPDTVFAD